MDRFLLLLSLLPLVYVNIWHTVLLATHRKDRKPHTISQHAVENQRSLLLHRMMHTTASILLVVFGLLYLLPHGYSLAGWLLIAGAIFDILEVTTLDKKSASEIVAINYHVLTAWAMALCYLLYTSLIITISGLPALLVFVVWISFAVLLGVSTFRRFKDFWITQHVYFCFLALTMLAAHICLLLK